MLADHDLITAAIHAATGGDDVPRFAALLAIHHSQVYRWRAGTKALPADVRRTCRAILADPTHVVAAYAQAAS